MKQYIYKKLNKDFNNKKDKSSQVPIYAWKDPPDWKVNDGQKEEPDEKRGYEELDFNIDSFIVNN